MLEKRHFAKSVYGKRPFTKIVEDDRFVTTEVYSRFQRTTPY